MYIHVLCQHRRRISIIFRYHFGIRTFIPFSLFQGSDGGDSEYESADEDELVEEEEEEEDDLIIIPDGIAIPEVRVELTTNRKCSLYRKGLR